MTPTHPLGVFPVRAPVQRAAFDLPAVLQASLADANVTLADGDVLAVSSKYAAIAQGRVRLLADVTPSPRALDLAARFGISAPLAELVLQESDVVLGGILLGFLLTAHHGVVGPNAGLDRSNIPAGHVVLLPHDPYATAATLRQQVQHFSGARLGVILTDSWLMPGRLGTTGVALATAGFVPVADERGQHDLFGNPMQVTRRGLADQITAAAQLVMGERDEATPFAVVRGAPVTLSDAPVSAADVAIDWRDDLYIESLTRGRVFDDEGPSPR